MGQEVLVVGSGPVGLVAALRLAKAGLKVYMIEAEAGIVESPRAMGYHWCVLDGLEELGLLDEMKSEGFIHRQFSFRILTTGEQIVFDSSVLDGIARHPYMLVLGQHKFAKIALQRAEREPNIEILWNATFQSLKQDDQGVSATVVQNGRQRQIEAAWLIGADGARSACRKALGLAYEGMTWPNRFVATNIYFDFDEHGWGRMGYLLDPKLGAVIGKLDRDGLWRVMFSESTDLPMAGLEERIHTFMQAILPGDKKYELALFSGYNTHQRSATTYRVGRVLLAGDAAHATNPTSGYGLVGGLFDSYALTDALEAVATGAADETALDRYASERKRVFEDIASPVSTNSMRLVFDTPDGKRLEQVATALRSRSRDPHALLEWYQTQASLQTPPTGAQGLERERRESDRRVAPA